MIKKAIAGMLRRLVMRPGDEYPIAGAGVTLAPFKSGVYLTVPVFAHYAQNWRLPYTPMAIRTWRALTLRLHVFASRHGVGVELQWCWAAFGQQVWVMPGMHAWR